MFLRNVLFGVMACLALAGCGSVDCNAESKCSGDPRKSQSDKDTCEKALEDECASEYEDLATCYQERSVCNENDGTDLGRTADVCKSEASALTVCCTRNDGAAGCPKVSLG